jgi:hypothetical protein
MSSRLSLAVVAFAVAACGPSTTEPPPEPLAECTTGCDAGLVTPKDAGTGGPVSMNGLPCDVADVLARKCLACHGTTPTNGAPDSLVTRADLLKESVRGGSMAARSLARMKDSQVPMPPEYLGNPATSADLAVIESWVTAGVPGGACASAMSGSGATP